jgi:branched-chain amino acid transport system permease protein
LIGFAEQIVVNGLLSGLVYMLMALGFTLIFGVLRIVNFAHGEFYMVGAFGVLVFNGMLEVSYPVALIIAVAATAVLGLVVERFLFRPSIGNELGSMIMSLAVAIVLQAIALIAFGPTERSIDRPISGVLHLHDATVPLDEAFVGLCALAILIAFYAFLKLTKIGLAMQAIAQDVETANLMGVRSDRVRAVGFTCAVALAAVAGGLMAPVYTVGPYMGEVPMLKAFVIVILGGLGSVPGALLGGLVLGVIESFLSTMFDGTLALIGSFAIVVLIVLFRPAGLLGKAIR